MISDYGSGKSKIQPCFPNPAKSGSGQISSQIWSDVADASAAALHSVYYR